MKPEKTHDRLSADLPINAQVVPAVVDDPFGTIIGEKITVLRSVRDDPLARMRARGFIAEYEYDAGRRWQYYLECAQIGAISAIDPSKDAVDGGKIPEAITQRQIAAFRKLNQADRALGLRGSILLREVLDGSKSIKEIAAHRGATSKRDELYIGRAFRECLDLLAELWGLRTERT